jgi:hypothetical protein
MSCAFGDGIVACGNFVKPTKRRPKNWIDRGYKIVVPYDFKWRDKLGDVECDCKEIEEHYQPWYGFSWYHLDDCAIGKHLKKHPGILNLIEVRFPLTAQSE